MNNDDVTVVMGTAGAVLNSRNEWQGPARRVLFVCSAGLLRSATAAHVFSGRPYHWNTRCAGCVPEYALIQVILPLLWWADVVYVMTDDHAAILRQRFAGSLGPTLDPKIRVLHVPDRFAYRAPALVRRLKVAMKRMLAEEGTHGETAAAPV